MDCVRLVRVDLGRKEMPKSESERERRGREMAVVLETTGGKSYKRGQQQKIRS